MANLPVIELGVYTNVSGTVKVGTDPVLEVIASADDADYVYTSQNATGTYSARFEIDAFPSGLSNVDTLSVQLRYRRAAGTQVNTWDSLRARVYKSDLTTALTNEATVASSITTTASTNSSVIAFTGVDTAATLADWNGAVLVVYWFITKSMGGDTLQKEVSAGELTGTYTSDTARLLSGTTAINSNIVIGAGNGALDVVHAAVLSGTTVIGATREDVYYFDGHTDITDSANIWSGDEFAFDGSDLTGAFRSIGNGALVGWGTTAPTSGGAISLVEVNSGYMCDIIDGGSATLFVKYILETLLTHNINTTTYLPWTSLSVPFGGWTWEKVAELNVQITYNDGA